MTWAEQVQADMQESGVGLPALAGALGLHRRTLERWYAGAVRPSDSKLRVLAQLLGQPEQKYVEARAEEEA